MKKRKHVALLMFFVVLIASLCYSICSLGYALKKCEVEVEQKKAEIAVIKEDDEVEMLPTLMWEVASLNEDIYIPESVRLALGKPYIPEQDVLVNISSTSEEQVKETVKEEVIEEKVEPVEEIHYYEAGERAPKGELTFENVPVKDYDWDGTVLNSRLGVVKGPSGKETYYNLPMSGVVKYMNELGYYGKVWVREDGAKMMGDFIMVAAELTSRPKGTILKTSLGWAVVADTGSFAKSNPKQIDIATAW